MARDLKDESEFGLPTLPLLENGLASSVDEEARADGAAGQGAVGNATQSMGQELREIYAKGEGTLGPTEPKAGTQ